jgi:putative DNA primase/helicase
MISTEPTQGNKIDGFWEKSNEIGEAEYLLKKGVGYYGIRFRDEEYGKVAVIPMRDIMGKLWSYQVINPDGSKRYAKDIGTNSLLHMLHKPINGYSIGISESYVTAATCFELLGIAMVTAFSAGNLLPVAVVLRDKYPDSEIVVFGDNDRHLHENKGEMAADDVKRTLKLNCQVLIPSFDGYPIDKGYSDWNDFVREVGIGKAREIIKEIRKNVPTML